MEQSSFIWILDLIVIAMIALPAQKGYRKGFIYAGLGFLPVAAAFFGARLFSPACSKWLRTTGLFSFFQQKVYHGLHLENFLSHTTEQSQTEVIEQLAIPDFLKSSLLENNNSVVHSLFETEQIQDYIAGYFANICINAISVVLVAVVIYIGVRLLLGALNIVASLPVISTVNRVCGLLTGGAKGICIVWFLGILLTFFYSNEGFREFFLILEQSHIASFLYQHNLLLLFVLKIFA